MSNLLNLKGVKFFAIALMAVAVLATFGMVAVQSASADCTITTTLRVGSTGAEVQCLQAAVNVTADGKFGPLTAAAVKVWQASKNLVADGVFGPLSLAKFVPASAAAGDLCPNGKTLASNCSLAPDAQASGPTCPNGNLISNNCAAAGSPATDGPLAGGAGDVTLTAKSTYSNENVIEGDKDAKVMAFEAEADDGSDISITSVKVELAQTVTTNSQRIDNYIDKVSVWMGSEKVGEADASDFSESNDVYTKSISLDNAVIRAGEKEVFTIAITSNSSLDSGDIDDDAFTVDVLSARFEDGDGVVSTETPTANLLLKNFDFDSLSTSGELDVKITKHSSSPSTDTVVVVDDVSNTNDVLLLAVNLKATGSDITVDDLSFDITPTGANANVIVNEYKLLVDGVEVDSISATSIATGVTTAIQFTNMKDEFAVEAGKTVVVKLLADINDTEGTFGDGDSILASLTSTDFNLTNTTIQDDNGDNVANADRTGSITGQTLAFYATGMIVTHVASVAADAVTFDTDANAVNTARGDFKIRFTVEAAGMDVYLDKGLSASSSTDSTPIGTNRVLVITTSNGESVTSLIGGLNPVDNSDVTVGTNTYMIADGDTAEFVLSVSSTVNPDAEIQAVLSALEWGNADTATGDSVYTLNMGVTGSYTSPAITVSD